MGRIGMFLLGALWLSAWAYAGFHWSEENYLSLKASFAESAAAPSGESGIMEALTDFSDGLPKNAAEAEDWFRSLTPRQQQCLIEAVGEERARAAIETGTFKPTARESVAIAICLK